MSTRDEHSEQIQSEGTSDALQQMQLCFTASGARVTSLHLDGDELVLTLRMNAESVRSHITPPQAERPADLAEEMEMPSTVPGLVEVRADDTDEPAFDDHPVSPDGEWAPSDNAQATRFGEPQPDVEWAALHQPEGEELEAQDIQEEESAGESLADANTSNESKELDTLSVDELLEAESPRESDTLGELALMDTLETPEESPEMEDLSAPAEEVTAPSLNEDIAFEDDNDVAEEAKSPAPVAKDITSEIALDLLDELEDLTGLDEMLGDGNAPAATTQEAVSKEEEVREESDEPSSPRSIPPLPSTAAMIRYVCPRCQAAGTVLANRVGDVVTCSSCGRAMRLRLKH